jgi:DNA topoisomerase IA
MGIINISLYSRYIQSSSKGCDNKMPKARQEFFDKADWLINATDPDREGELIFTYVCDVCKCDKPYKRVWIEDLTEKK